MSTGFLLPIPKSEGGLFSFTLNKGEMLFVLGANGTGKSSLISHVAKVNGNVVRISAHRQTWFSSNTPDLTPSSRENLESTFRAHSGNDEARYRDIAGVQRPSVIMSKLIDSETMRNTEIVRLMRAGNQEDAERKLNEFAPMQFINELLLLSNMPIEVSLEKNQQIVARRKDGPFFGVDRLSDGERNAFLIAAEVLTAEPGSLLLIDEPERHLHRSIISPLLARLFEKRSDCAFIVATHDVMLPLDNRSARTLLIRSCVYQGSVPISWTADLLEPYEPLGDELKRDILGARQKIIFVEGKSHSLDTPLYALLFPEASIIAKENCRSVEQAVGGLRAASGHHWVQAWGIVDNDRRSLTDITRLKDKGVYALAYFSVESLYYHTKMIRRVVERQVFRETEDTFQKAIHDAINAAQRERDFLIQNAVERLVRREISNSFPDKTDLKKSDYIFELKINVSDHRTAELEKFEGFINARDLDSLLRYYPLRDNPALDKIAKAIGFNKQAAYEDAVLKILQEDPTALAFLKSLFEDLADEVAKPL